MITIYIYEDDDFYSLIYLLTFLILSGGEEILSGSDDNTIKLWNKETGKLIKTFEGHSKSVTSVCFSPASQKNPK